MLCIVQLKSLGLGQRGSITETGISATSWLTLADKMDPLLGYSLHVVRTHAFKKIVPAADKERGTRVHISCIDLPRHGQLHG